MTDNRFMGYVVMFVFCNLMTSFSVFGMLSLVHSVLFLRILEEVEKSRFVVILLNPFNCCDLLCTNILITAFVNFV